MDKFRIEVISATVNPQQLIWAAMHQDYSEEFVWDRHDRFPDEEKAGELVVKHLLAGNRGHYGCYSEDTEVFTNEGWIKWSDVNENTYLAAVSEDGTFKFERPSALQRYYLDKEPMVFLNSNRISYSLTPDHRVYIANRDGNYAIKSALDCINQKVKRFKLAAILHEEQRKSYLNEFGIDKIIFAKLVGFFIGDGSTESANTIGFNCRLPRKLEYLSSLGVEVRETTASNHTMPELGNWFKKNCYCGKEKVIPIEFLRVSVEETLALLDGLMNSDGTCKRANGSFAYDTTSKLLLEQLKNLATLNGYVSNVYLNNISCSSEHKDGYRILFSKEEECVLDSRYTYTETVDNYTGFVCCATVSTGLLLVRHKGKQFISGNCIEHPQIVFNVGYFPHSMMQQIRTHRVGMCLTGDTEVYFTHPSLSPGEVYHKYRLGELAELWHHGRKHQPTFADADYMKRQISARHILVLDTANNKLTSSHIRDIYINGVKEVFKIKTVTGETISASKDHLFWTNFGWQKVSEFSEKTQLCRTNYSGQKSQPFPVQFDDFEIQNEEWKTIANYLYYEISTLGTVCSFMPKGGKHKPTSPTTKPMLKKLSQARDYLFASFSDQPGGKNKRLNIHRIVLETFKPLDDYSCLETRHLNGNTYDNWLVNLEWGTSKQNKLDNISNNTLATNRGQFVEIESIESLGLQPTYDLEVEHRDHNFIANGLVVHNSFDVQSFRYTGSRIIDVVERKKDIEDVFYLRPVGNYTNRQGKHYFYSEAQRHEDLAWCQQACEHYKKRIDQGLSEEHARGIIPFDARQHFVMSCNMRSLMHLLDLRWKKDAQLEAQKFCELLYHHFEIWAPAVAHWYLESRAQKARLSP